MLVYGVVCRPVAKQLFSDTLIHARFGPRCANQLLKNLSVLFFPFSLFSPITSWVTSHTSFSLERLARHFGISQREVLEQLIESAAESATNKMTDEARDHFYRVMPRVRGKVTE